MKLTHLAAFGFLLSMSAYAARMDLEASGTLDVSHVPQEQWYNLAQKEIHGNGPILGIPGGVKHAPPLNQLSGEDCWSFALAEKIQTFLYVHKERGTNPVLKIGPDYLEFWHIYDQIVNHLYDYQEAVGEVQTVAKRRKATPEDLIAEIKKSFKLDKSSSPPRKARKSKALDTVTNLFQPDVGNLASTAIDEIEKYGIAPYKVVKTKVKTDEQENQLEAEIANVTGQIILDAIDNKTPLSTYAEDESGKVNEPLYQLLKTHLEPIFKAKLIRPTDTWVHDGKTYSPHSLYGIIKHFGLDYKKDFRALVATPATHAQALKAIAIALLTDDQPVPIGITLLSDEVNADKKTNRDFAEATGLFTETVCPRGGCVENEGGHEIVVVNFLGTTSDGQPLPKGIRAKDEIAMLQDGRLKVTELIIENSWGFFGGTDVNGNPPPENQKKHGGYYILTSDYLLNSGSKEINDMWDFVLPNSVADQFPHLKKSE